MTIKLNHTIVAARDNRASALFICEVLGLEKAPLLFGRFALVTVGDQLTLDFMTVGGEVKAQHYAFLVSESEFDQIFGRIRRAVCRTGPIRTDSNPTQSTIGTTAAASTSKIRTGTCSKS
jgi:hypothetical protein